ncbi:hypothetical protein OR16_22493 [Cupriavidus basilensis OR16]|uniref:Uncharacterized protein n=1 Tax=Cupriavidus basilensis OR16 TaxID=1127483 RepID=H1S919_9BURK|nr:hypothetical protein OR16_22493 [Cupriavidus basilensis OR16]
MHGVLSRELGACRLALAYGGAGQPEPAEDGAQHLGLDLAGAALGVFPMDQQAGPGGKGMQRLQGIVMCGTR